MAERRREGGVGGPGDAPRVALAAPGRRPRRPRRSPGAALALALVVLLGAAAASAEPADAWVRRAVAAWLTRHRLDPQLVDVDALAGTALRLRAEGASQPALDDWLRRELLRAQNAFAPAGARHDPRARYALPFDVRIPRLLSQDPGGERTHTGRQRESFDFVMPIGTPVRAAREGVVARVVDGFTSGGADADFSGNAVYVLHADGTFALYLHLSPGIPVKAGQRVARGDVLGKSGATGRASAPHLHFAVAAVDPDGVESTNLPIRFGQPGGRGFVPKRNEFLGTPPKPTVVLSVRVDGRATRPDERLTVRRGARLAVEVLAPAADGSLQILDGDPRLELVSMTPWNLSVDGRAVVIRPMPGFPPDYAPGLTDVAVLGAYFLDPARGVVGLGQVQWQILAGAAGTPTQH